MSDKETEKLARYDENTRGGLSASDNGLLVFFSDAESFAKRRVDEALTKAAKMASEHREISGNISSTVEGFKIAKKILAMKSQGAREGL